MIFHFVEGLLEPEEKIHSPEDNLTFSDTTNRAYEEAYWNQIYFMAHGKFINKDNADVIQDQETMRMTEHHDRDLHKLGDYLINKHREAIIAAGMDGKAEVGEMPFRWETDFEFIEFGGWKANQEGSEYERNILVIIPGKNRREAFVMADHYWQSKQRKSASICLYPWRENHWMFPVFSVVYQVTGQLW